MNTAPPSLARLPKVELHCHLAGTLRQPTLASLAQRHGVPLPRPPEALYRYAGFYDFIEVLRLVARVVRTRDDFARICYEAIEDAFTSSNVRHLELGFNPQYFLPHGASYETQVLGLVDGIEAAERAMPVSCLLIACFDREFDARSADETLDTVLAHRHPRVVGIGLDGPERAGPPARFEAVYRRARQAGLRRTAHVCEDNQTLAEAPPQHLHDCLDLLGCERLDHGYNLVASAAATQRARDSGVHFTVCGVTSVAANMRKRLDGIAAMAQAGLSLTLNTDDPAMFHTHLTHTYEHVLQGLGWGWEQATGLSLAGVDASWLDPGARARLRQDFRQQIATIEAQHAAPSLHSSHHTP